MDTSNSTSLSPIVYIYALAHPETGDVRYIGVTKNLTQRFHQHLYDKAASNPHRKSWIAQLRQAGLKPVMSVLEETDESAWAEREKWWILEGRRRGWRLTNLVDGGQGTLNPAPETRRKLSERPHTWGHKISIGKMGHQHSVSARLNMSKARTSRFDHLGHVTDRIENHLKEHPDDGKLSCRSLAKILGVTHGQVAAAKRLLGLVVKRHQQKETKLEMVLRHLATAPADRALSCKQLSDQLNVSRDVIAAAKRLCKETS